VAQSNPIKIRFSLILLYLSYPLDFHDYVYKKIMQNNLLYTLKLLHYSLVHCFLIYEIQVWSCARKYI
jgi:hypothetical protein